MEERVYYFGIKGGQSVWVSQDRAKRLRATSASPHHGLTVCCGLPGEHARSHAPTFGYRDIHAPNGENNPTSRWNSYPSHVLQYETLAAVFYRTIELWMGFMEWLDRRTFAEEITHEFQQLCSIHRPGIAAWRLPPHTLFRNLITILYTVFPLPTLLLEGFGAGAYSAAVAALMSYEPREKAIYLSPHGAFPPYCSITFTTKASPS